MLEDKDLHLQGRDQGIELSSDDVRLPHDELVGIDLAAPDPEREKGFLGPGTEESVIRFQKDHGLEPGGVLDEKSAKLVNIAVDEKTQGGGGDTEDPVINSGTSVVRGQVTSAIAGLLVRAYDQDLRAEALLGESSIDPTGTYEIRYVTPQLGCAERGGANLRIAVCGADGREIRSSGIV